MPQVFHTHGPRLEVLWWMVFKGHAELLHRWFQRNKKWAEHHGGFTLVVDEEAHSMGISVCSTKDRFCKARGAFLAQKRIDDHIERDGPIFYVFAPVVKGKYESALLKCAVEFAFKEWVQRGWPLDEFQIKLVA